MPSIKTAAGRQSRHAGAITLGVATFAYFVAVIQRSSMGVAALEARDKFDVNAATLSALGVAQLVVYAAMQIPVGMLLDRFGSRVNLTFGALVMFLGQLVVSASEDFSLAVAGRMLVGFGDAFTFIALVRVVNVWFAGTKASLLQQLAANVGQIGQVLSAISFHGLLQAVGWAPAFAYASFGSLLAALLALTFVFEKRTSAWSARPSNTLEKMLKNLSDPAVWTGFWVHFTLQSSGSSFILLWGYPFLVSAEGLDAGQASGIMTAFVFIGFLVGPIFGSLGGRFPYRRSNLVITMAGAIILAWIVLIAPGSPSPYWLLLACVLVIAAGGPASMLAFDYIRSFVPYERASSASGLVNMGGFVAAFSLMYLVGIGLDSAVKLGHAETAFSLSAFRVGFAAEILVTLAGLVCFVVSRNRLRIKLFKEKGIQIRPLAVVLIEKLSSIFK